MEASGEKMKRLVRKKKEERKAEAQEAGIG